MFQAYPAGGGFCPTARESADLALSLARTEGNRAGSVCGRKSAPVYCSM